MIIRAAILLFSCYTFYLYKSEAFLQIGSVSQLICSFIMNRYFSHVKFVLSISNLILVQVRYNLEIVGTLCYTILFKLIDQYFAYSVSMLMLQV